MKTAGSEAARGAVAVTFDFEGLGVGAENVFARGDPGPHAHSQILVP